MSRRETRLLNVRVIAVLTMFWSVAPLAAQSPDADREGVEFFEKKIRPVLVAKCYECHSSQAKRLQGSFSLETRDGLLKGGELGPAVVPGDPDKSLLIQAIRHQDDAPQMPPKESLPVEVVADFEAWVKRGLPDPRTATAPRTDPFDIEAARQRWPYAPPVEPTVPAVKQADWPKNTIDYFVLAKLEEHNLTPVADADKRTLLRRVTYDLTGLPPTPREIQEFLADDTPEAFARLVDRLLATPRYGERWARHWLDVVRYADTAGDNSDYPIPQMSKYRNWVIDAFNADKPYDQFIREQIAGDLLPSNTPEEKYQRIVATGYLASARRFGSVVKEYPQHLTIEDTIDNLGRAFLGQSLSCARCHNHKFDPFTTEDYYALYGIFHSTRYPWPGIELDKQQRDLVPLVPEDQVAAAMAQRKAKRDELTAKVKRAEQAKGNADKLVKELTQQIDETKQAESEKAAELASLEEKLAQAKKRADERNKAVQAAKKERDTFDRTPLPFEQAYAVAEGKPIENVKVQMKGDPQRLGSEVPRRFPQILGGQTVPTDSPHSGRRQLAEWIADPKNPLTARVLVNRLWQQHFGRGIVATPNDFGKQGQPPTHPELLDWLALRFIENGWSIKSMHRLMLLSHTYQLSSDEHEVNQQADPSNEWLWRHSRRRLDAESIRDTLLVLGGNLDPTPGGPHPFPPQQEWNFTQHKPFKAVYDTNRRSVYLMTQRIQKHPFLAIFDGPETGASTPRRMTSTTTLQALYLLNDPFLHDQAARFARRLVAERKDNTERIRLAYEWAYARQPTDDELQMCERYLRESGTPEDQAWESFTRALFRTNEFVYVD